MYPIMRSPLPLQEFTQPPFRRRRYYLRKGQLQSPPDKQKTSNIRTPKFAPLCYKLYSVFDINCDSSYYIKDISRKYYHPSKIGAFPLFSSNYVECRKIRIKLTPQSIYYLLYYKVDEFVRTQKGELLLHVHNLTCFPIIIITLICFVHFDVLHDDHYLISKIFAHQGKICSNYYLFFY